MGAFTSKREVEVTKANGTTISYKEMAHNATDEERELASRLGTFLLAKTEDVRTAADGPEQDIQMAKKYTTWVATVKRQLAAAASISDQTMELRSLTVSFGFYCFLANKEHVTLTHKHVRGEDSVELNLACLLYLAKYSLKTVDIHVPNKEDMNETRKLVASAIKLANRLHSYYYAHLIGKLQIEATGVDDKGETVHATWSMINQVVGGTKIEMRRDNNPGGETNIQMRRDIPPGGGMQVARVGAMDTEDNSVYIRTPSEYTIDTYSPYITSNDLRGEIKVLQYGRAEAARGTAENMQMALNATYKWVISTTGSYGNVYGIYVDEKLMAMKVFKPDMTTHLHWYNSPGIVNELFAWEYVKAMDPSSRYSIPIYRVVTMEYLSSLRIPASLTVVMPYARCTLGDVSQLLVTTPVLNEATRVKINALRWKFTEQILNAIHWLHSTENVVHRDLKNANFLIHTPVVPNLPQLFNNPTNPHVEATFPELFLDELENVKVFIADFGLAVVADVDKLNQFAPTGMTKQRVPNKYDTSEVITTWWRPLERYLFLPLDIEINNNTNTLPPYFKADVFSMGLILATLWGLNTPKPNSIPQFVNFWGHLNPILINEIINGTSNEVNRLTHGIATQKELDELESWKKVLEYLEVYIRSPYLHCRGKSSLTPDAIFSASSLIRWMTLPQWTVRPQISDVIALVSRKTSEPGFNFNVHKFTDITHIFHDDSIYRTYNEPEIAIPTLISTRNAILAKQNQ